MLFWQNVLFSETLGIMPIKCIQQLHLWGSIQQWHGCCLGTCKGQTWKQHRNPHVESHPSYRAVSLGTAHPPLCKEGWGLGRGPRSPLCLCCRREGACALFGGLAGGLGVVGCSGHPSREEAAVVGKGRGCVSLNRASWRARHQPGLQPPILAGAPGTVPGTCG